jgi:hypothetical protein
MNWPPAQHCKSRGRRRPSPTGRKRGPWPRRRLRRENESEPRVCAKQRNRTTASVPDASSPGTGHVVDDVTPALGFYCPDGSQYVGRRRIIRCPALIPLSPRQRSSSMQKGPADSITTIFRSSVLSGVRMPSTENCDIGFILPGFRWADRKRQRTRRGTAADEASWPARGTRRCTLYQLARGRIARPGTEKPSDALRTSSLASFQPANFMDCRIRSSRTFTTCPGKRWKSAAGSASMLRRRQTLGKSAANPNTSDVYL